MSECALRGPFPWCKKRTQINKPSGNNNLKKNKNFKN